MAKIFSVDFRKGSYIDSVNKIVGVPTSLSKLIRTDKGTALARAVNHNGVTYTTGSKSLSKFTIVAWIKQRTTDTGDRYSTAQIGTTQIIRRDFSATGYDNYFGGSSFQGQLSVPTSTSLNKWMQFVVTYDGANLISSVNNKQLVGSPSATTATLDYTSIIIGRGTNTSRYSDSDILKFEVYDDVISDKELELDYKALLESQVTEKPIRGFELVKPTDLSYLKDRGLLAAYNFKRNGDTLVDISGNGYNFTIEPGTVERDNGLYFPMTRATITSSITLPAGSKTVCWRGTIHNIPGTFARIYSSYLMFNAAFNLFYYRAANDTIITLATGFTTADLNKEFDFVYVQEGNSSQKLYINGVLMGSSTETITSNQLIGEINSTTNGGYVTHKDLRFYTRAFSEQEVKDYHNSFIKPIILEDWSGSAVGDVI